MSRFMQVFLKLALIAVAWFMVFAVVVINWGETAGAFFVLGTLILATLALTAMIIVESEK